MRRGTITTLTSEIRERGRESLLAEQPVPEQQRSADLALVSAVQESILAHHYERRKDRIINYELAETLRAHAPPDADAVLCVDLLGIVPTAGRELLKVTAIGVRLISGVNIQVSTNDAILRLMLVNLDSGKVIWFHTYQDTPDVRSDSRLRRFVAKTCSYLLEPIK